MLTMIGRITFSLVTTPGWVNSPTRVTFLLVSRPFECKHNRELKQTTTATATGTSLNKRFNEQSNSCARAF